MVGSYAKQLYSAKCDYFDGFSLILFGEFEPGTWSVLRLCILKDSTMKIDFFACILDT